MMKKIEGYIEEKRKLLNSFIGDYLKRERVELLGVLFDAIEYSVEGGKRIRPILVMASSEAFGGTSEDVLPTAAAFELFHVYSLIHDDLPAMDDDDWRRGRPSTHKEFGEAVAILTGDALIPMGFKLISIEQTKLSQISRVLKVIRTAAEALSCEGIVGGQLLDLGFHDRKIDENLMIEIHYRKTAFLIRASLLCGAILQGADERSLKALRKFGNLLGLAFQAIDDVLDFGEDEDKDKLSLPNLIGLKQAKAQAKRLTEEAIEALAPLKAHCLKEIAEHLLKRKY
jgi:geranylgeranyl diphosphate synthase type II